MFLSCYTQEDPGDSSTAARVHELLYPNIQKIEVDTDVSPQSAGSPIPSLSIKTSSAADLTPVEDQGQPLPSGMGQAPAQYSSTGPFSDIFTAPGQKVVAVNGLPQYLPAKSSHTWSGPSPTAQAKAAQFEGYQASIKGYSTRALKRNGTTVGQGTLQITSKNGTVVYQAPFSAPLVPKPVLQQKLNVLKIIASGQYTSVRALLSLQAAIGLYGVRSSHRSSKGSEQGLFVMKMKLFAK
jgi:hypothetical protein